MTSSRTLGSPTVQHSDFWKLSQLAMKQDGDATEGGKAIPDIMGEVVDYESLEYLVRGRVSIMLDSAVGAVPEVLAEKLRSMMVATYYDGFLLGHNFAQEKH